MTKLEYTITIIYKSVQTVKNIYWPFSIIWTGKSVYTVVYHVELNGDTCFCVAPPTSTISLIFIVCFDMFHVFCFRFQIILQKLLIFFSVFPKILDERGLRAEVHERVGREPRAECEGCGAQDDEEDELRERPDEQEGGPGGHAEGAGRGAGLLRQAQAVPHGSRRFGISVRSVAPNTPRLPDRP